MWLPKSPKQHGHKQFKIQGLSSGELEHGLLQDPDSATTYPPRTLPARRYFMHVRVQGLHALSITTVYADGGVRLYRGFEKG